MDDTTACILEEIVWVGTTSKSFAGDKFLVTPAKFRRCWRQVDESTLLATSTIHFEHYPATTALDKIKTFLTRKITIVARISCPPEQWGTGL